MCNTKESNKAYQQRLGTWQVKPLTKTNHETLTQTRTLTQAHYHYPDPTPTPTLAG